MLIFPSLPNLRKTTFPEKSFRPPANSIAWFKPAPFGTEVLPGFSTFPPTKTLISKLQDVKSANKVKKTLSKRYESRKGGYTRIIKAGFRYGDNAPMAIIEFIDRDIEAKKVDRIKKDTKKAKKINEAKEATS